MTVKAPEDLTEELSKFVLKQERFETILSKRTEDLNDTVQSLSDHIKALTDRSQALSLEVEELRGVRKSLSEEVIKSVDNRISKLMAPLSEALSKSFNSRVDTFIKDHLESLQQIQRGTQKSAEAVKYIVDNSAKRFAVKSLTILCCSFASCFLMSAGFLYFYPQEYFVHYDMGPEEAKRMVIGKIVMDNLGKFNSEAIEVIENAAAEALARSQATKTKF